MLGSMGVTFRRFEPIYAENKEIIGFVMVGKYYKAISDTNRKTTLMLGILFITSLTLALNFAKKIRKSLFGLDPEEIGRLYIEERLIIDNLESGLIALNTKNEILKVNSVFSKKYKNLSTEVILNKISSYLEKNENIARNIEVLIEGGYYYIKILPIYDLNEYDFKKFINIKEIRGEGYLTDVITIISANGSEDIKKALSFGWLDYLIKPFDFERFKCAVKKFYERNAIFNEKKIVQQDLDKLGSTASESTIILPKGLNEKTLKIVIDRIDELDGKDFNIKEICELLFLIYKNKKSIL